MCIELKRNVMLPAGEIVCPFYMRFRVPNNTHQICANALRGISSRLPHYSMEWSVCPTSHITPHTSHVTPHTSHLTPHTSHLTPHTWHMTHHTSHLTLTGKGVYENCCDDGEIMPEYNVHPYQQHRFCDLNI